MTSLSFTTELEAVNTLLATIHEAPINSLTEGLFGDASLAKTTLDEISREVQSRGWHFNTDKEYVLFRTSPANEFEISEQMLEVDTAGTDAAVDVAVRGKRLYDRQNNRFTFPDNPTLCVNVIWLLAFTDLPEAARRYITIRSARLFNDRALTDEATRQFTSQDEQMAYNILRKHHARTTDRNMITGAQSALNIIQRRPRSGRTIWL